jgi:hypothetical protein
MYLFLHNESLLVRGNKKKNQVPPEGLIWQLLSDTNVVSLSNAVSSWVTKDSLHSFNQTTSGIQPVIDSSDLLNGIAPIRFTNDYLISASSVNLPIGADPFTISCLVRCRSALGTGGDTNYSYIWGYGGTVNTDQPRALGCRRSGSTVWWGYTSAVSSIDSDDSYPYLITMTYDGLILKLYRNIVLIGSGEEYRDTRETQFTIGTWLSVLSERVADCSFWEISTWNKSISSLELSRYINYINNRYKLNLT